MNSTRRHLSAVLLVLWLALAVRHVTAQSSTNSSSSLPPVPVAKSPIDAFRELLAMDAAALRVALSNRTEQSRARLKEKINEYKAMDADERELRLLTTELRWYLLQFMQMPATNRADRLADIRGDLRPLIETRLARWDDLPEVLRAKFLQNEQALALLLQLGTASDRLREQMVAEAPPELRDALHRALARLDAMSPAERRRAFDVFENVFNMTPAEKQGALRVMSDAEKKQMEQTLEAFNLLSVEERRTCIRSYERFVGMTKMERTLFLRNVQTWEAMSPKERQQWRELVKNVEILPPFPKIKPSPPPMPPAFLPTPPPRILTNKT